MKIFETVLALSQELESARVQHQTIGFVATMGALHSGHIRLVEESRSRCHITVVSIFVNPLQFNRPEDFQKYPVTREKDEELLRQSGADILFRPSVTEVYPGDPDPHFFLGHLDKVMEGAFRPGHFTGVAKVVHRLFRIIQPHIAFFGLKDFQQVVVIREVVLPFHPGLKIQGVETVREPDGLAMSSRNQRLDAEHRAVAGKVAALFLQSREIVIHSGMHIARQWLLESIKPYTEVSLEYYELATEALVIHEEFSRNVSMRLFIAFYCGDVRLIDNIPVEV